MFSISVKNIKKSYGIDVILENISFDVEDGQKVALVGGNGAGKTTFFKIISGEIEHDSGDIYAAKGYRIGYLNQIPVFEAGFTIKDVIKSAFDEVYKLKEKMEQLETEMSEEKDEDRIKEILFEYDKVKAEFERNDGYNIDYKIDLVANGLGISKEEYGKSFDSLSGGEKTRICMAKLLADNTDILLLDEPTNHLDMESVEWLEKYINESYKGTVIVISHDRYFMDKVVSKVVEIENKCSEVYDGNYTYYVEEKERRVAKRLKDYEKQQELIGNMEEKIQRFRDWSNYKAAMSIEKALNKVEKVDKPTAYRKKMRLEFESEQRSGNDVLTIKNLNKSFGDRVILEGAEMQLHYGSKAFLLGSNGAGKSTLVKMIMSVENANSGSIRLGTNVKIAYLEQQFDSMNGIFQSVLDYFMDVARLTSQKEARNILAAFLFFGEDVYKCVNDLSGGERTRLKLAELMHSSNNLLILDEPTNHLDIDSKEALEDAILSYGGTVLIISHDRYFINKIADTIYELDKCKIEEFSGDYDYYKRKKDERLKREEMQRISNVNVLDKLAKVNSGEPDKKETKKQDVKNTKRKGSPKREMEKLEKKIEKLEIEIAELEEKMATPEVIADYEKLLEITELRDEKSSDLQELYDEWESLAEEV